MQFDFPLPKGVLMLEPVNDAPNRDDWDELDWERFLQRADVRTAKYQELYETLSAHPQRDHLIAREMGWEQDIRDCGVGDNCPSCARRHDCEAYEMFRLMADPIEEDECDVDLMNCFEQLRHVPAYVRAQDFAERLEDLLRRRLADRAEDPQIRRTLFAAQMVPAQVAGGHGIGYDRDSLCGNIANCKRALRSLADCLEELHEIESLGLLASQDTPALWHEAERVSRELNRWIDNLRARIWWR